MKKQKKIMSNVQNLRRVQAVWASLHEELGLGTPIPIEIWLDDSSPEGIMFQGHVSCRHVAGVFSDDVSQSDEELRKRFRAYLLHSLYMIQRRIENTLEDARHTERRRV